jgi:ABC-type transport system involved in cytochrome c biogenesis permease subunit
VPHERPVRGSGRKGKRIALRSIIVLAHVLFMYLGVNYLPGLHTYLTD